MNVQNEITVGAVLASVLTFACVFPSFQQDNNGTCRTMRREVPTEVTFIIDNATTEEEKPYENYVQKERVAFKLGNPNIVFTLLPRDYDVLRADRRPKDVMLDLRILYFNSLQTTQQVRTDAELFEAQGALTLEWVDTRINSISDLQNIAKRLFPTESMTYAYTNELSFHVESPYESPLWIPMIYSKNVLNLTTLPGRRPLLRIRIDESEIIRFSTDIVLKFQCLSQSRYYPYDVLTCSMHLNSRDGVVLVGRKISFDEMHDLTNKFVIRNSSVLTKSEDTLIPCEDFIAELDGRTSCLEVSFYVRRNMPYFEYVFYPPTLALALLSYTSLYLSPMNYSFRVFINVTVISLLLKLYFSLGLNKFGNPTTAVGSLTIIEQWLFGCLTFASVILFQYILNESFPTFHANTYTDAQRGKRTPIIKDDKLNEATQSPFLMFIRQTALKICYIFIRSKDDLFLDIVSRFMYLVVIITLPLWFHLVYLPGLKGDMEDYNPGELQHLA